MTNSLSGVHQPIRIQLLWYIYIINQNVTPGTVLTRPNAPSPAGIIRSDVPYMVPNKEQTGTPLGI